MRKIVRALPHLLIPLALLILLGLPALAPARPSLAQAAPFTAGNLVVYRVGDGGAPLVDTGNPVFLDEFTPTGALARTLALPTAASGADRPVFASNRAGEGLLTRSNDGRWLILTGFGAQTPGTTPLPTTLGTTVPRVVAKVSGTGQLDSATALGDFASGSVPTAAASTDGFSYWVTGGAGGVRFVAASSAITSTQLVAAPASLLQVAIFEGQLYASTAVGAGVRIGAVGAGLPSAGSPAFTPLPGLPTTGTPYAFFFANLSPMVAGVDTLYVAYDDQGLSKFALEGGVWAARGTVGTGDDDYRGLTGVVDGASVTLYATRKGSELVRLVDRSGYGGSLGGAPTLLATAPANTAFRGVALAPRASDELAPDLSVSVSGPGSAVVGTAYSYAISVRNSGALAATGASVRFTLPAGVSYLDAMGASGFTPSQSGGVVTFSGGSVPIGGQVDLLVSVAAGAVGPVTLPVGAAVADPAAAIDELDEGNNSSTQSVITSVGLEGAPADTTPPDTNLTAQPDPLTIDSAASFSFGGQDDLTVAASLIFQCSLDGAPFTPCASPQAYAGLAPGVHAFQVRAVDAAGNPDPTPAAYTWTVRGRLFLPMLVR